MTLQLGLNTVEALVNKPAVVAIGDAARLLFMQLHGQGLNIGLAQYARAAQTHPQQKARRRSPSRPSHNTTHSDGA